MTSTNIKALMLRGISLFVATVFTVTTLIGNPSEAMAAIESFAFQDHAKFQKELQGYLYSLPPEIGTISETYFGERGTGRAERTSETVNRLSSPVSQHEQFIVLVQDAHANPEGQQNVAAMLKYLETKVPGLVIGLEGASGELHPEYLNLAKGFPEANRAVIEDLHQKGELNGAELYLLGQHQHIKPENGERETNPLNVLHASSRASQAYGIENTALYHDDLDTYRDLLSHTDEIQTLLNPLRAELEKESSQKLNGELRAFLKERSRRKDGRFGIQTSAQSDPDFQAYTRYLRQQALKLLEIDLKDAIEQLRFPNLFRIVMLEESRKGFDPEAAKSQWNEVVQTLQAAAKDAGEKEYVRSLSAFGQENGFLKKNIDVSLTAAMDRALYPRKLLEGLFRLGQKHQLSFDGKEAFWKTWKLAVFQAEIDVTELMREMDMLEGQMIEKLARSEAEKALVQKLGTFDLLEKMLRLELSRSEYDKTREDEAAIRSFSADSKYLGAFLDKAEHFYEVSLRRDEALVTNLLALTQGERYPGKSQPKGSSVPRVSVLYSGGFHTPGVEAILRQKGIGYAVFSPRITRTDHGEMYQKVMAGDNADLSAYFKVKNPFATKQAAIFFKEMLEVAAPALFEKYQMKPEEIAANVQRSIGSNPVLSTAVTVEPVGPKESASLSFQSTGRRESVPKNSAVMPESLTAVWWRSPDAGEVTSVNLANSAVTTTVSFTTPKALMLNIIQGIPTKQQTVTLNSAAEAPRGFLAGPSPQIPNTRFEARKEKPASLAGLAGISDAAERGVLERLSVEAIKKASDPEQYLLDTARQYLQLQHSDAGYQTFRRLIRDAFKAFPPSSLRILSVSGLSGSGKTTATQELLDRHPEKFIRLVRTTTRPPRPEDAALKNHHFLTVEDFNRELKEGLIYAPRFNGGHHYGYSVEDILSALLQGDKVVVMEALNSAKELQSLWPETQIKVVGILPAEYQGEGDEAYKAKVASLLAERMRKRDPNIPEAEIVARLQDSANVDQIRREAAQVLVNPDGMPLENLHSEFEKITMGVFPDVSVQVLDRKYDAGTLIQIDAEVEYQGRKYPLRLKFKDWSKREADHINIVYDIFTMEGGQPAYLSNANLDFSPAHVLVNSNMLFNYSREQRYPWFRKAVGSVLKESAFFEAVKAQEGGKEVPEPTAEMIEKKLRPAAKEIARIILEKFQGKGGMVSFDAQSGAGKSTLTKRIKEEIEKQGAEVIVIGLDGFLKDRAWRQAIQKLITGTEPLTFEEREMVFAYNPILEILFRKGSDRQYLWEDDFFEKDRIATQLLLPLSHFFADPEQETIRLRIPNYYDQTTKKVLPEKVFPSDDQPPITKKTIVIVEGKYAAGIEFLLSYKLRFRIEGDSARIRDQFTARTRKLSPDDAVRQDRFFERALGPSFDVYAERWFKYIDYVILTDEDPIAILKGPAQMVNWSSHQSVRSWWTDPQRQNQPDFKERSELRQDKPRGPEKKGRDQGLRPKTQGAIPKWIWAIPAAFLVFSGTLVYLQSQRNADRERNAEQGQLPLPVLVPGDNLQQPTSEMVFPTSPISILQGLYPAALEDQPSVVTEEAQRVGARHESLEWEGRHLEALYGGHGHPDHGQRILQLAPEILKETNQWVAVLEDAALLKAMSLPGLSDSQVLIALAEMAHLPVIDPLEGLDHISSPVLERGSKNLHRDLDEVKGAAFYMAWLETLSLAQAGGQNMDLEKLYQSYLEDLKLRGGYQPSEIQRVLVKTAQGLDSDKKKNAFAALMSGLSQQTGAARGVLGAEQLRTKLKAYPDRRKILSLTGGEYAKDFYGLPNLMHSQEGMIHAEHVDAVLNSLRDLKIITPKGTKPRAGASPLFPGIPLSLAAMARLTRRGKEQVANARAEARVEKIELSAQTIAPLADDLLNNLWNRGITLKRYAPDGESFSDDEIKIDNKKQPVVYSRKSAEAGRAETAYVWTFDQNQGALLGYKGEDGSWRGYALFNFRGKATYNVRFQVFEEFRSQGQGRRVFDFFRDVLGQFYKADAMIFQFIGAEQASLQSALSALGFQSGERSGEMVYPIKPVQEMLPSFELKDGKQRSETRFDNVRDGWSTVLLRSSWEDGTLAAMDDRSRMAFLSKNLSKALKGPDAAEHATYLDQLLLRDKEFHHVLPEAEKLIRSFLGIYRFPIKDGKPVKVGVEFSMYGEQNRLMKKSADNPHGEDAIAAKLEELDELFSVNPKLSYELLIMDDGERKVPDGALRDDELRVSLLEGTLMRSPFWQWYIKFLSQYVRSFLFFGLRMMQKSKLEGNVPAPVIKTQKSSGEVALDILRERFPDRLASGQVQVRFINRQQKLQIGGKKGSGIILGMRKLLEDGCDYVIFTDADRATHMGQSGLLLEQLANGKADAAIGSRWQSGAVVKGRSGDEKRGSFIYNMTTKLFLGFWGIRDTQCGFKGFTRELLEEILPVDSQWRLDPDFTYNFAFDTHLLLRIRNAKKKILEVPVVWIGSPEESTLSTESKIEAVLSLAKQVPFIWSSISSRSEVREPLKTRSEMREQFRNALIPPGQRYVNYISEPDEFSSSPDAFLLLGNPSLRSFLEFSKKWKAIKQETGRSIPIVLAGGYGRGTPPLARRIIDHYKSLGRLDPAEEAWIQRAMTREGGVYESDLMRFVLEREGVAVKGDRTLVRDEIQHSTVTVENFTFSAPVIETATAGVKHPVIAIVTAPQLLRRAQATARKAWDGKTWTPKKYGTYPVQLEGMTDEELIEMMGYVIGYPQAVVDSFKAKGQKLNLFSEYRGLFPANNPSVLPQESEIPANIPEDLQTVAHAFEGFLGTFSSLRYEPVGERLVPETALVQPGVGSSESEKASAVLEALNGLTDFQRSGTGQLLDFAGETALMDLGDIKALLTKGELSGKKGARAVAAGKLKEWIERPVVREVDEGHAHEVIRVVPGGFENFGIFIRELGEIGLLDHDAIFSLMEAFVRQDRLSVIGLEKLFDAMIASGFLKESEKDAFLVRARKKQFSQTQILRTVPKPPEAPGPASPSPRSEVRVREVIEDGTIFTSRPAVGQILQMQFKQKSKPGDETEHATFHWDMPRSDSFAERFSNAQEMAAAFAKELTTSYQGDISVGRRKDGAGKWVAIPPSERGLLHWIFPAVEAGIFRDALSEISKMESSLAVPGGTGPVEHPVSRILSLLEASKEVLVRHLQTAYEQDATIPAPEDGSTTHDRANLAVKELIRLVADFVQMFYLTQNGKDDLGSIQRLVNEKAALYAAVFESQTKMLTTTALYVAMKKEAQVTHDLEKKELEHIRDVLSQSPLPKRFSVGGWKQEVAAIIQGRFQSLDGELGRQLEVTHVELEKVADEKPDSFPKRDLLYQQQALEKRRKAVDVRLRELTAQLAQAADISKFLGAVRKDLKILATTMEIDKKYIDEHEDAPTRSNAASGKQQIYEGFPFTLNERVEKETQQKSGASMLRLLYDDFFLRVFQSRLRMGVHRGTQNFTSFSDSGKTGQDFFREVMDDLEAKEEGNQGKGVPDAGASYILVVPLETSNLDISRMMERYKHQIKGIIGVGANRQTHWVVLIRGRAYVPQILLVPASQEGKLTKLEGTKAILMPQQGRQGLLILNPSLEDLAAEKKKAEDYRRLRRFQGLMRNIPSSIPIAGNFEAQSTVAAIEGGTLPGLIRTDVDIVPKNEDDSSGVLFQYLKTLATGVVETKVDPLKWLQSFQTRSEIRTAGSEDLMARFSRLDPEGVGNAEAIHGLLKFWAVPFEQILTQKAFSGGDVPIRTIDLQRDSKNRAILQMLEAIAAEHPASTLRKDPSQPISGFDLYENSSLGELVLVLELAAMIVAAQKAGRTLSETERGRLVPLFPLIKTHAQFEWIRKKLWPLAQQIALWEIATGSGANPEEIERAEGDIRKIGEETRFGIMVEYMSLLEVPDPEDQTPDPSKRKKIFSPEMVKFLEDPFIVRLNVGNNDLWKDYWQTKNVEVDRENSAAAFLMDDLDGHLTVTLEALISRAQQSGKKVCFCGGIAETDKFLLAAEWWRRKFGVKDLSAKDSPFSVSVTGDVVARVNHALQVFRAIPDEELGAVFGAAEGSDILDGRAQELSNRYLSVSEKVSILVEEWQERYESAGFHHALYRLNIDPEKGIGGSSEFIFLKNLMQVWLANDPEDLASLRLSSKEDSVDRGEIQRTLQYLANRGMLIPANIEKVLQSFDFIQSVQETYRELQGKDPDKFSGNLYPAIMGEFINAWEKKYGRPDWLAEGRTDRDETSAGDRKEEQRINDFYRYFHNSAASIFYTVRRTLHEIDGVLIRPVYTYGENEGKLEAFAGWDGQPSWILGQTRYGLTMSRERGRKGEAGYYIHVDHALENFRANPALMFRVFMLAAEKGAFISHRTQWAMEALMLEGSLDYQDAFNDFFGELLRSKKDISYVMWRMEEFGFLDKSLHHLSELNMYSLKDGTLFPLKMQALQTLETLERLDTKEKGFVYQRAAGVYRELRSDPEAVQLARLAVMLHPIVEVEAGDRFSVEDVKRITHEFLQKLNMDNGPLDQPNPLRDKLVWLMLNQHRFARHGFLSEDDIVKTMSEVVHSKGVTLDLFRVLYAVTFSKQAAEANPESRIMLPRQGADSPLADLDMLFFAGMKMLGDKQLSAQTAMKEAKQTVIWGGKEELAAQLGEFIRAQKWGSILDDYLANTQGGDDVSLRELLVKTVETPALFDPLFRQFSGRTSTYYMRTMDLGSLLKQLFFFRHLLYLKEKGDRSTRATIFSPLPHQYNQAYEVIFGSAFEESGDVALYTRTLFENGFSVENAAIRNPPGQPAFIRYLGFFPHGEEMPMVQKKITSELGAIFAPINIGDKVFRILKTDMEIRFKRADEVYGRSIIVDKRDAWIGPETKAKFLDDVSHQGKTVSVLTVHIASSNWRGQLLILSTVLSLIHGCDIENLKFEHIKGFPPETQIFLTRKGKILSRAQKDLIAKNVARILDMKPITILGKEAVVEQPTPKSEKIVKNLRINPLTKLHNRPAAQLVKLIAQYNVENAVLRVADRDINLKSIGAVLASGIVGGTDVTIILEGKKNAKLKELMYRIQAEVVGEQGDSEGPIKLFMPSQRSEMRAHEWREFLIVSKRGIHAVPTELIVKTIKNHQNLMIRVENENGEVRATFPNNQTLFMSIMRLAAAPGSTMKFVVEGPDQRSIQNFFTELLATAKDGNEDIFRQVQSESKVLPPGFTAGVMEAAVVIKIAERSETRVQEERECTVLNKLGIHAQPSTLIKKVGDRFPELEIEVEKDGERVNGKKIMGLLALAAGPGSVLKFVVKGPEVLIRRYFQELAMIEDNGEKVFKIPPRAESRPLVPILKSGVMELASGILSSRRSEVRTKEGVSRRVVIQRGLLAFAGIALLGGISEILAEQREKAGEKKFAPADYQLEVVPVSDSLINAIRNPKSGLVFASTINPYRVNDKDQKIPSGWVIANVNGKRIEVSSRNPNNFGSAMAKVIGVVDRSGRLRFYDNQTYRTTGQEIFAFQAGPFAVKPGGQINENVREWYRALFHGKASVIGVDAKGNVYTKLFVGQEPFGITGRLRAKAMMEELAVWKKTNGITEATFVDSGTAGISRYDRKSPPYVLIARKRLPAVVPVVTSKPRSELRIPAQGVVSETGEVPEEFVGTIISTKPEITPADSMKFAELLGHIFLNALIVFNFYRIEEKGKAVPGDEVFLYLGEATDMLQALYDELNPENPKGSLFFSPRSPRMFFTASTPAYGSERHKPEVVKYEGEAFKAMAATLGFNELRESMKTPLATLNEIRKSVPEEDVYSEPVLARLQEAEEQLKVAYRSALDRASGRSEKKIGVTTPLNVEEEALRGQDQLEREARQRAGFDRYTVLFEKVHELAQQTDNPGASVIAGISRFASEVKGWEIEALIKEYFRALKGLRDGEYLNKMPSSFFSDPESYEGDVDRNLFVQLNTYMQLIDDTEMKAKLAGEDFTLLERSAKDWLIFRELNRRVKSDPQLADQADALFEMIPRFEVRASDSKKEVMAFLDSFGIGSGRDGVLSFNRIAREEEGWFMKSVRPEDKNGLVVTNLTALPVLTPAHPLESFPVLGEGNYGSVMVLLGPLPVGKDGKNIPAVIKLFRMPGTRALGITRDSSKETKSVLDLRYKEELSAVQVLSILGVGPKLYGVLRDQDGLIMGYAMQYVVGESIPDIIKLFGFPGIQELFKKLMSVGLTLTTDVIRTPSGDFVQIDPVVANEEVFQAFVRAHTSEGSAQVSSWPMVKTGRSGNVGIPPAPVSFHIPAREEALGEVTWQTNEGRQITFNVTSVVNKDDDLKRIILRQTNPPAQGIPFAPDLMAYSIQGKFRGVYINPSNRDITGKGFLAPLLKLFFDRFPEVRSTHELMINPAVSEILARDYDFKPAVWMRKDRANTKVLLFFENEEDKKFFYQYMPATLAASYEIANGKTDQFVPMPFGVSLVRPGGAKDAHNPDIRAESRQLLQDRALDKERHGFSEADIGNELKAIYDRLSLGGAKNVASAGADIQRLLDTYDLEFPSNEGLRRLGEELTVTLKMLGNHAPATARNLLVELSRKPYIESLPQLEGFIKYLQEPKGGQTTLSGDLVRAETRALDVMRASEVRAVPIEDVVKNLYRDAGLKYRPHPSVVTGNGEGIFVRTALQDMAEIVRIFPIAKDRPQTVLDAGHGDGIFLIMLAHAYPQSKFTGIEMDPELFEASQKLLAVAESQGYVGKDQIRLYPGNFRSEESVGHFKDADVIYYYSSGTSNVEILAQTIVAHLKSGGKVVEYGPEQLLEPLRQSGGIFDDRVIDFNPSAATVFKRIHVYTRRSEVRTGPDSKAFKTLEKLVNVLEGTEVTVRGLVMMETENAITVVFEHEGLQLKGLLRLRDPKTATAFFLANRNKKIKVSLREIRPRAKDGYVFLADNIGKSPEAIRKESTAGALAFWKQASEQPSLAVSLPEILDHLVEARVLYVELRRSREQGAPRTLWLMQNGNMGIVGETAAPARVEALAKKSEVFQILRRLMTDRAQKVLLVMDDKASGNGTLIFPPSLIPASKSGAYGVRFSVKSNIEAPISMEFPFIRIYLRSSGAGLDLLLDGRDVPLLSRADVREFLQLPPAPSSKPNIRSEARLPVGTSAVETLGLDTIKNYVADKFGTPVRLTDEEVKAYFGEKVLRDSQREGRAFFIQKLDPKEDIHFLGEWKAELQSDEVWLRAREAKGDSREITKQQFPYFGYISDVAVGVVSRVGKRERLEGFVGFDGDPESFDVKRLKYTFHLAVPQIEIYYKNIGSDGRIKGVADLLMDTLISMANNPDLRVTGGIRFNAMTPGSQAFAKRRGFKPGSGVERILSQESVQREAERIAKVTPSGIGGRPEMRGALADILKEKFSVGSVLASADLDTGVGNFIPEFKTFLEGMGYRVNTAIGTEPLQSIIDKAPAGIRGSIVHANAQFPEEFRSLGENTFDIVTINHIETAPGELARRAKELLKPSGLLLVTIEETDVTEGIDARIIREIREAGFDVQTLKKPTDYPEYNTQFRSQVLLVAVPKSFRFNPPAKQDGSGAFPRAEIRVLDLGQGATRTIQTVLGKIDFKPVAGLLSEAIQIPVVEAAEAVGAFSAEGIAAGLKGGVTEENLIKARLWIAMKLLEAFRAQQSAEGRIDNEALQKVIASLERFKVTGAKDSTLEERGVHVALPLLTQAKLEALAEFAPILLAFAVALNTKLYLNVQGAAPKGLEQKFLDRAARNGITIAEGQFRIFGVAGSEGSLFRSLKEPGVREDVLLAGEKKDLPGTDRATLWYNSPEAQENMKILAAEISEALYAALDPKISKGSPRNIATHFQELTTALMNAIEGFQSVKQSA